MASAVVPSANETDTRRALASATTWLFVTMRPSSSTTKPEPVAWPWLGVRPDLHHAGQDPGGDTGDAVVGRLGESFGVDPRLAPSTVIPRRPRARRRGSRSLRPQCPRARARQHAAMATRAPVQRGWRRCHGRAVVADGVGGGPRCRSGPRRYRGLGRGRTSRGTDPGSRRRRAGRGMRTVDVVRRRGWLWSLWLWLPGCGWGGCWGLRRPRPPRRRARGRLVGRLLVGHLGCSPPSTGCRRGSSTPRATPDGLNTWKARSRATGPSRPIVRPHPESARVGSRRTVGPPYARRVGEPTV